MYPSPAENRENLNFYWLFRAISSLYNTCGIMETPTFHKMSHAIAQRRTLTHRHTTGHWDSLVIYEGIFIDGLYDQLEWYLWGQSVSVLDHWLSIRTIPAVHCSAQRKQEKRCMNKTVWCIFLQFFWQAVFEYRAKDSVRLLDVTASFAELLHFPREWIILVANRSSCQTIEAVGLLPHCVVAAPFLHGERRLLSYWDLTALSVFLFFFQEFLAQCRAITLTRVYALCNSKHP